MPDGQTTKHVPRASTIHRRRRTNMQSNPVAPDDPCRDLTSRRYGVRAERTTRIAPTATKQHRTPVLSDDVRERAVERLANDRAVAETRRGRMAVALCGVSERFVQPAIRQAKAAAATFPPVDRGVTTPGYSSGRSRRAVTGSARRRARRRTEQRRKPRGRGHGRGRS